MQNFFSRVLFVVFLFSFVNIASASVSSGTIDASNKYGKVCHSVGCVTPTPGVINFAPTGTTAVTIDDTAGINGIAWGNELGWINLNPTGSEGLTINPANGVISGKAWSQVAGWINFAPTGQTVVIDNNGQFVGWAWAGGPNGGWIKFDCVDAAACVKTDWRPITNRPANGPVGGGGGGGGSSPSDMCFNISGVQYSVPVGYVQNGTTCTVAAVVSGDVCPNISGIQTTLPSGMALDQGGLCINAFLDIDHDGVPNVNDPDIDGDGIPNSQELGDADHDGVPDAYESNSRDTDGDGVMDVNDPDDDGDGKPTAVEQLPVPANPYTDADNDGIPDYLDRDVNPVVGAGGGDSDHDGITDMAECPTRFMCGDADGNHVPDYMQGNPKDPQLDTDGDGVPDVDEQVDSDHDGVPDYIESRIIDTDGDGLPNQFDDNDDGDVYPTIAERTETTDQLHTDQDNDGILAYLDAIDNRPRKPLITDDTPDNVSPTPRPQKPIPSEPTPTIDVNPTYPTRESDVTISTETYDTAQLGVTDDDADGILDSVDPVVAPNKTSFGGDSDGDGLPDAKECVGGYPCPDEDMDGIMNYMDTDDDNDGTASVVDTDGDNDSLPDAEDRTPHGDRTEWLQKKEPGQFLSSLITFNFVPGALQMYVDSPKLVSAIRSLTGGQSSTLLINDPNPTQPARVEFVGFSVAAAVFSLLLLLLLYGAYALYVFFVKRSWGLVYDAQTGVTLANARVMLYDERGMLVTETVSDNRGNYSFKASPGKYQLRVAMPNYAQANQPDMKGVYDGGIITVGMIKKVTAHVPMRRI